MIYFLYRSYEPNTASTNRALSYIRNVERMKIPINVVYFMPNQTKSRIVDSFEFVSIKYYWDNYYINNSLFKYVSFYFYVNHFLMTLKKGDKVYLNGLDDIKGKILNKEGVEVYYEKTECPEVVLSYSRLHKPTLKEYYDEAKRVKALIVISTSLKDYFADKGVSEACLHIVNMTVDPLRFKNVSKQSTKEKYIAYCGTASNNKDGVDILIKSFAILCQKIHDVKLYIIGETPSKNDESGNEKLIRDLGIEDRVHFTGRITAEEMPQLLVNAQVLTLARPNNIQAKYGFPTKLGEYLLTRNPVVVTSVGDIPRFLRDKVNALVVPPGDPSSFAGSLLWALTHPAECQQIGEAGYATAIKHFNAATETKKLMDIILK